jgi:hypothetical protein
VLPLPLDAAGVQPTEEWHMTIVYLGNANIATFLLNADGFARLLCTDCVWMVPGTYEAD